MTATNLEARLAPLLAPYRGQRGVLLHVLHRVQEEVGYIGPDAVRLVAHTLGTTPSLVYGALTFYADLRTRPPASHEVQICEGPTCRLRGARRIERSVNAYLGTQVNHESEDGRWEFRVEQCSGLCHLAPYLRVDGVLNPHLRVLDVPRALASLLLEKAP
ncbi:MAG: NAD(P)H-dependent oxidoreductase subunit E [Chloroflexi bacterium]|nr:NAD(P)H-dependent oxidoreductase subunit E [Chloroflexota bacterium]